MEAKEHKHIWKKSTYFFVGWLYPSIFPWYCECGAFRRDDGTILEPIKRRGQGPGEVK